MRHVVTLALCQSDVVLMWQVATVVQVLQCHVVCIAVVTVRHGINLPPYPTFQMHKPIESIYSTNCIVPYIQHS